MERDIVSGLIVNCDLGSEINRLSIKDNNGLIHEIIMLNVGAFFMLVPCEKLQDIVDNNPSVNNMKISSDMLISMLNNKHQQGEKITVYGTHFSSNHFNSWTNNYNTGISLLSSGGYLVLEPFEGLVSAYFIRPVISYIIDHRYRIRNDIEDGITYSLIKKTKKDIIISLPLKERQVCDFVVYVDGRVVEHTLLTSSEISNSITIMFPFGEKNIINANFTPNGFPRFTISI